MQNYMRHWQIYLLTFTMKLFLDMALAWDPTFTKYPENYTLMELIFTNQSCILLTLDIVKLIAQ